MPGWIDTHSHIYHHFYHDRYAGSDELAAHAMLSALDNAVATLNAGFTTIQSPGAAEDKDLREAIARGLIPGPRILTSLEALVDTSGPPEKIRQLVRERKQQGANFIKIFASASIRDGGRQTMTDAQIQAACGEAKAQGMPRDCPRARGFISARGGSGRLHINRARRIPYRSGFRSHGPTWNLLRSQYRPRAAELL